MAPRKKQVSDNLIIPGVIYARYSSHAQREESIEQQIEECTAFAQANGINIVGIYADKAISGRTDRRNEFQRLMRDAEKRKFAVVIAYKSNRISRNMLHALQYEAKLDNYDIKTLYAKEEFGNTAAGRFALRTMMNVNQFYSENMSEDIKRGMRDNAEECKVNGSLPYGYKKGEDGKYALDEHRAVIVREIFNRVLKGDRYCEIIDSLNARGLTTKTGRPFNKNSFHRMLVNERYIGVYEHSGIRVENGIPPIISKEVFYMVQDKLKEGMNEQGIKRKMNSEYLLTGKLFCGDCGSPMVGLSGTSRSGDLHYYYTCKNHRDGECPKANIKREYLEQVVVDMTRTCINDAELIDWLVKGYLDFKKHTLENSDIPLMEVDLKSKKKSLANLLKAVEAGIYNNTTAERMKELEEDIKIMERSISLGKMIYTEPFDGDRLVFYLHKISEGQSDSIQYRKELFRTFVKSVRLWNDRIEVEYNFTGTDDDGNPHKVVREFCQAKEEESANVRAASPHGHQNAVAVKRRRFCLSCKKSSGELLSAAVSRTFYAVNSQDMFFRRPFHRRPRGSGGFFRQIHGVLIV